MMRLTANLALLALLASCAAAPPPPAESWPLERPVYLKRAPVRHTAPPERSGTPDHQTIETLDAIDRQLRELRQGLDTGR